MTSSYARPSSPAAVSSVAHVLVETVHDPVLDDSTQHHLARVLRVRSGETVTVTNGRGDWALGKVSSAFSETGRIELVSAVQSAATRVPTITVAIALPKGEKPEVVVQKLTELGVDQLILFRGDRSVPKWDASKASRNLERLRAVAVEALQQSRGVFLPALLWVDNMDDVVALGTACGASVARADADGDAPRLDPVAQFLLVGPEGGWSERERSLVQAVALGDQVLRAETAAMAGATVLCALRAGLVNSLAR